MLEVEDGRDIVNVASNVEGHSESKGGTGCARYPNPAQFLPLLSLLKSKLALKSLPKNDTQHKLSLPNIRFGELKSEGSRMGESTIILWQETKPFSSLVNV